MPDTTLLRAANLEYMKRHLPETGERQPVHTVYGGAHLFRADTARKLGAVALASLAEHAPGPTALAAITGMSVELAELVLPRVRAKLEREPVEDFRIDFEDGYGNRSDAEEDDHARSAAREVARGQGEGMLPPFIGIRIKPLSEELHARSLRTLELFLAELLKATKGELPPRFFVTLPKITTPIQVRFLADVLAGLEPNFGLPTHTLRFEIMVETPESLFLANGAAALPLLLDAGAGRISAAHFGTYDFTASCNITAAHQHMNHPACDFARMMMQVCLAGRGVWLSDGSTALLPTGKREAMHQAWRRHYDDVRRSLMLGFYQGWDLHPAQLVTRYAALYAFFLEGFTAAADRLRNFMQNAAQATLIGNVFDDAATGQGLLNHFLRGINSGAFTEQEVIDQTTLTADEIRSRSFPNILSGRKKTTS